MIQTPFSFLTPWILCFRTSSITRARSSLVCPSGTSSRYIKTVTNGACPLHVIKVTSWYWIVWIPCLISSYRRISVILSMIASSIDSPITLRSFTTFLRSFFRLMSTNGAKCANVKDCPPYWLLATWATICVVTLHAVKNECGFSINVSLITVPFWSISSKLIRSQLCSLCAK